MSSCPDPTWTPVPTEPPTAVPEPSEPPTAVPKPTKPPTAVPEPTEPPTAVPEPTEPPTAVPEPTEPPTAVPEPTEPPTAVPTAVPSGWIQASATTIDEGDSVLITAGWSPTNLDTQFVIADTQVLWRSSRCSGTTRVFEPDEASLTVYGCDGGSSTVSLKVRGGATLASVTITVREDEETRPTVPTAVPTAVPTPSPPDQLSPTQRAYRWLHIEWRAESVFTRFIIHWRDDVVYWQRLFENQPAGQRRVIIDHAARTAEVRGLPYGDGGPIKLRVTGVTANNRRVTSADYTVARSPRPNVSGHQHDHTAAYRFTSSVDFSVAGTRLRAAIGAAASEWTRRPFVWVCRDPCASNSGRVIPVELHKNKPNACGGLACLTNVGKKTIKTHVSDNNRKLKVEDPPVGSDPNVKWFWTRVEDDHLDPVNPADLAANQWWLFIDAVMIHELGHALGLKDITDPNSIMDTTVPVTSIQPVDDNRLYKLYESHTAGAGW